MIFGSYEYYMNITIFLEYFQYPFFFFFKNSRYIINILYVSMICLIVYNLMIIFFYSKYAIYKSNNDFCLLFICFLTEFI